MLCGHSFLERCDPRSKLIALFLIVPVLLSQPVFSWGWGIASGLLILVMVTGLLSLFVSLARQLLKLRWLFATIFIFHAFFTPGQQVLDGWSTLTQEGLYEGVQQVVRLVFLVSLSWVLVRTTTPLQLLAGLYYLFRGLEGLGIPVKKGFAMVAFSLGQIPRFVREARWIDGDLSLRITHIKPRSWRTRLQRTVQGGEVLLFRLLMAAYRQEESLRARGFERGLPFSLLQKTKLGWRDLLLLSFPSALLLGVLLRAS